MKSNADFSKQELTTRSYPFVSIKVGVTCMWSVLPVEQHFFPFAKWRIYNFTDSYCVSRKNKVSSKMIIKKSLHLYCKPDRYFFFQGSNYNINFPYCFYKFLHHASYPVHNYTVFDTSIHRLFAIVIKLAIKRVMVSLKNGILTWHQI